MAGDGKPRLRTACDPCSGAKVGCDKNHPACKRCLEINIPCSYSESRKHGKRSLRRKLAQDRAKRAAYSATANAIAETDGHGGPQLQPRAAPAPILAAAPLTAQPDGDGGGGGNPLLIPSISPTSPMTSLLRSQEPVQPLSTADTSGFLSLWSLDDNTGADLDMNSFPNWDIAELSLSGPPYTLLGAETQQKPRFGADANEGIETSSAIVGEEVACMATISSSSSTTNTHDCEAEAISILRSLQHAEVIPGATSCSSDPVHYAGPNPTPRFDRVLLTNRVALDGWIKLMQCSCVQCPHLIQLYVSVLTKMLFWYSIAANERTDSQTEVNSSNASDSDSGSGSSSRSTTLSPSPPTVDQFGVRTVVIRVGLFGLDAEDQANLRRFLLMRELRRMDAAIGELMNVDRTAMENSVGAAAWRAVQWSLDGVWRVRDELRGVIQKLSKGLSL